MYCRIMSFVPLVALSLMSRPALADDPQRLVDRAQIHLEVPVFNDTDDLTLNRGVGRILGTGESRPQRDRDGTRFDLGRDANRGRGATMLLQGAEQRREGVAGRSPGHREDPAELVLVFWRLTTSRK